MSNTLTENRILYNLKSTPHTTFAYDFETIHINGGDIIVRVAGGEIRTHRLADMDAFTITPRNGLVNNCIPRYDQELLNK